jgi:putative ABC transport system ATP-binding protein
VIQIKDVTKLYPAKGALSDAADPNSRKGSETLRQAQGRQWGTLEENTIRALDSISLDVGAGEWLSIMGPSGSGKSTLVNLIGCLDRPTSGEIWLNGQNIAGISASELNRVRAEKIGFIFQQFHLIPFLTAVENVMLAQYFHSMTDEKEAIEALTQVGLGNRAHHLPSQLSGGEQQRVCIARALINDPKIILADEPTGNLDAVNEEIVLRLLREFHRQGRTIVMVTHDPVVARLADRRVEFHHGKIASQEVFAMADEEQFEEVLEELWVLAEHGEIAEVERMEVHGALPVSLAVEKMMAMGLVTSAPHGPQEHNHKPFVNPCHDALKPVSASVGDGSLVVELTQRGRERAASIIRRHRLAERLFTDSLAMDSESEIEQQACKFEHILSPEATDKICTFLGHPRTCPHGAPIPPGECCGRSAEYDSLMRPFKDVKTGRAFTRDEMNERR